ncbi:MAG TPA: thiol reductant ABC exporter subunit CydC [Acetobacteraceae bacterium]|nr:thiol reductant ABC exporter subunit CydC [Acetobacteraceae bacterium]
MTALLRILGLWRRRILWLVAGLLVSLLAVAAGVGVMTIAGRMIGVAFATGVLAAPVALDAFGVGRVVLRYTERLVTHGATFRALADLRVWFFRGLSRSAAGGLGFRQAGDVLARLVGDVEALDGLYLRIVLPLAGAVLLLPGLVVLLRAQGWLVAAAVGVLFAFAAFVLPRLAAATAAGSGDRLARTAGSLRITAVDALTGLREVRAFGAEGRMLAAVQSREAALLAAQHELARRTALAGVGALLCGQAAVLAVLAGAGAAPVGAVPGVFLVIAAFELAGGLPRAGVLAGHAAAAAQRVLEAAEATAPVPDPPAPARMPAGASLRFDSVHFRWRADHPPVFDGLTLEVPEEARVGILGPSGSGKSTLAALALKLAAPQQGRVLLGGTDLALLPAVGARSRIGWLGQATHLFDDTIRRNLLLARPEADDAALWAALEAARIAEMVRTLPNGLDTWVGEGGARFSGGQGRRLALARALLTQAPLLILDEPCAGLDAETEREFLSTLNDVAKGRTLVLIVHRLTGVERLDRIWRLSGGHAVAAAG